MPSVHLSVEPGYTLNLEFCCLEHMKEWLKQHGLEEANG